MDENRNEEEEQEEEEEKEEEEEAAAEKESDELDGLQVSCDKMVVALSRDQTRKHRIEVTNRTPHLILYKMRSSCGKMVSSVCPTGTIASNRSTTLVVKFRKVKVTPFTRSDDHISIVFSIVPPDTKEKCAKALWKTDPVIYRRHVIEVLYDATELDRVLLSEISELLGKRLSRKQPSAIGSAPVVPDQKAAAISTDSPDKKSLPKPVALDATSSLRTAEVYKETMESKNNANEKQPPALDGKSASDTKKSTDDTAKAAKIEISKRASGTKSPPEIEANKPAKGASDKQEASNQKPGDKGKPAT